ncbi:MAG: PAS domain-containing methyl-accepting chemotaxis protein [Phenylobacterium sp.]|uniref:methyl-accepting chemotaxis protein n=1 Tax=Phenylobacterium sp. TaxID=1871053 RepID=UPI0012195150|nr:PAS domain-containing methyl-accepting chemotaxis protein [Phenylobacterium sp.]TAJ70477.1 MAG: PAS domain-containing methyl-accepting chemotaxis protein [Phenylobacterium sp.]
MKLFGGASDARKAEAAHVRSLEGMVAAIERSQAVIEFELDGTIIRANKNFLDALGYVESEVVGRRHAIFVDPQEASGPAYREFWQTLNRGEFVATKFRRIGKGGREVWIQASYNPVLDPAGKPVRVVKFATDITATEHERMQNDADRAATEKEQSTVVSTLGDGLKRLSEGDLTASITADFQGSYARIKEDFNSTASSLRSAMASVLSTTAAIRSGADEISTASDDLSRRTEQQAASLEETAAALDEITATVKRSAEGAKEASEVASGARTEAERSGDVVRDAVSAIHDIQQSSAKISNIIGVIDEIAFQTNLLALNAGVEAARAGEAGRGFAVVAQEVRALAQRSAEAAKEIKTLISSSGAQVDRGVKLVTDTGHALTAIVERVATIDGLVSEIAQSAREQSTGLGEVNTAVNQMDQVTQQNAAMVEEATAASAQLRREAVELGQLVARFDVGDRAAAPARPSASERPRADAPALQRKLRAAVGGQGDWNEF